MLRSADNNQILRDEPAEFCGIREHPETTPELHAMNAAGTWPDPPEPPPSIEQVGQQFVEDRREMAGHKMAEVIRTVEILTGPDADSGGSLVNFARFAWQSMPRGAMIYLPHGTTRKEAVEWLEEAQRFIVQYWGAVLRDPQGISFMQWDAKRANWKADRRRKPKPVKDDNPETWPVERHKAAERAVQAVGVFVLLKLSPEEREATIGHWLGNNAELRRDALAWARTMRSELDNPKAKRAKKGGRK